MGAKALPSSWWHDGHGTTGATAASAASHDGYGTDGATADAHGSHTSHLP